MNSKVTVLFFTLACATAKNILFDDCVFSESELVHADKCKIRTIKIDPCTSSIDRNICDVSPLSVVHITLEYTAYFDGTVHGNVYHLSGNEEKPLLMTPKICNTLTCIVPYGIEVNSTIEWPVLTILPKGETRMKVRLWNDERHECCGIVNFNIQS